ncbi:MAG: calcium-translocating P-type ATPase, PMCA-type [Bacilli bacterium]|nr:calcium-translocating P-type ATPase, PMCA-type [Bacilli bacterium]
MKDAYLMQRKKVLEKLRSDEEKGLSGYEAEKRLQAAGRNELIRKKKDSIFTLFMDQFKDPMVIILVVAGGVSFFLKEVIDACIILSVIIANAVIGVIQEYKAEKAIEALEQLSSPQAKVKRDGYIQSIDSALLVMGDIVELEAGSYIPADMRLLSSNSLKVEESILTGESEAVEKDAAIQISEEVNIHDQKNMVFMSTFVTYGKAEGIVVASAIDSEVGKVAQMLEDSEEDKTPLQKRLARLSKILGFGSLFVCIFMFALYMLQGRDFFDMLLISISLAVAAIPEGLPAVVTIVLALGIQTMSKQKAIVRKLHAVETLGSVSVICSDKTGTLTQNRMHVITSYSCNQINKINEEMLHAFALCNNVHIQKDELVGEPTENALVGYALSLGYDRRMLLKECECVYEIPFDSTRKRMTTLYRHHSAYIAYTKGALESILELCSYVMIDHHEVLMSASQKERILMEARQMSMDALRVLAIAQKRVYHAHSRDLENDMVFLGMAGLMDPPRPEVKESIALCHKAGIRVNMITGDNPLTAYAIAKELHIAKQEKEVLSGRELDQMDDETLRKKIGNYHVFARVTPQHKVRIVKALKANDEVVAMSGDGVNDAPSLKSADIGIAMGKNGTDVCKQASDMILSDDNFATIVSAVEEGRNVYLNIQKAVLYLLSCNLGEIMALFLATLLMPHVVSTLNAVQILWVNLVTDAFPALALGVDPKDQFIMNEQPRSPKESLFAHGGVLFTIMNGMLIGTMTIVAFRFGLNTDERTAQTMAFMVLSISQLFHALNLTSRTHSLFEVGIFKNRWLILTIVFGITLQICVASLPIFQTLLKTTSLSLLEWGLIMGVSMSTLLLNELSKWFAKESEVKKLQTE